MKNFIEGQFHQLVDDKLIVKTSLGTIMVSIGNKAISTAEKKITLGIRSDFIILCETEGPNILRCKLMSIIEGMSGYLYEFVPICLTKTNYCFNVEIPKTNIPPLKLGQEYFLYLPPERISVITS